mgnify:CR=1 FL=1
MHYLEDTWRVEIKPSRFNHMLFIKEEDNIVSGLDLKSKDFLVAFHTTVAFFK